MDAEKTKYLGGDVKHTHLVKGLDYALLQKVSFFFGWEGGGVVVDLGVSFHVCGSIDRLIYRCRPTPTTRLQQ